MINGENVTVGISARNYEKFLIIRVSRDYHILTTSSIQIMDVHFSFFLKWPTWRRCRMSSSVRLPFCRPGETAAMAAAAVVLAVACVVVVSSGLAISHGTNIQVFATKLSIKRFNKSSGNNR